MNGGVSQFSEAAKPGAEFSKCLLHARGWQTGEGDAADKFIEHGLIDKAVQTSLERSCGQHGSCCLCVRWRIARFMDGE